MSAVHIHPRWIISTASVSPALRSIRVLVKIDPDYIVHSVLFSDYDEVIISDKGGFGGSNAREIRLRKKSNPRVGLYFGATTTLKDGNTVHIILNKIPYDEARPRSRQPY